MINICISDKVDNYDPRDVERLKSEEKFALIYVRKDNNVEKAINNVNASLAFRKEYEINGKQIQYSSRLIYH